MPPFDATSWKKLAKRCARGAKFRGPAKASDLLAVEDALGLRLPEPLRDSLWRRMALPTITARKGHWLAPVLATPPVLVGLPFAANLFTEGAMTVFWFVFPIPLILGIYVYFLWFRRRAARGLPARPP